MVLDPVPSTSIKPGQSWTHVITLADVTKKYPPQLELMDFKPTFKGEVLAFGRAVYETQPQEATDMLLRLTRGLCDLYAPGNLWLLPTYERLPYPFAVYWPLGCAFKTEKEYNRRFDWFLWMDDDVLATPEDFMTLMAAADPVERPFVSALGYDRFPPHSPSVTEVVDHKILKWVKAPASGTHAVSHTGLCMALFHRSLSEKVPEPWFGISPPVLGVSGMNPDYWWSVQMSKANITPYICCDTNIDHLGRKLRVDREYSEQWQKMSPKSLEFPETKAEDQTVSSRTGARVIVPQKPDHGRDT